MFNLGFRLLLIVLFGYLISPIAGHYPGLRRPPSIASLEYPSHILAQLIEDQARRRFQLQLAQQQFYSPINNQLSSHHSHGASNDEIDSESYSGPSFTYRFPEIQPENDKGEIPFAVNPSDPRFFEGRGSKAANRFDDDPTDDKKDDSSQTIDEQTKPADLEKSAAASETITYFKPKTSSLNVNQNSKLNSLQQQQPQQFLPKPFRGRDDIKKLVERLELEGKANTVLNGEQQQQLEQQKIKDDELVIRQRMGLEGDMGMYMVALLAGITAAILVGIMALGIAWITLQKRTKAAADVEYPAYGVTGPNKDLSPSGDRRLAQSAQMYHYQHQKQQIIAMENRQAGDHHNGLSDVESDDDNEEGDYTVYECPGLAPTGEMEVKNPLFLDDTPITPIVSVVASTESGLPETTTIAADRIEQSLPQKPVTQKIQQIKSPMKPKQSTPPPAPQRKSIRSASNGNGHNNNITDNTTTTPTPITNTNNTSSGAVNKKNKNVK